MNYANMICSTSDFHALDVYYGRQEQKLYVCEHCGAIHTQEDVLKVGTCPNCGAPPDREQFDI